MAHVRFTPNLIRLFPGLAEGEVAGDTVADVIANLGRAHPKLAPYLVDERGALRTHVNVFVDDELVRDRRGLADPVGPATRLFVVQALSGG